MKTGQYSQAVLEFLKLIGDEVRGYGAPVNYHDEMRPGLTGWFIITVWKDAVDKTGGHAWIDESWYKYEHILGTDLLKINCGGNTLGIARSEKTLKKYENWHKELRAKYTEHLSAKDINIQGQELNDIVLGTRQWLHEFSDIEPLPGICELYGHAQGNSDNFP
jgi:hypothetical protein